MQSPWVSIVVALIGVMGSVAAAGMTAVLAQRRQSPPQTKEEDLITALLSRAQAAQHGVHIQIDIGGEEEPA